jgi:hypothetical protein
MSEQSLSKMPYYKLLKELNSKLDETKTEVDRLLREICDFEQRSSDEHVDDEEQAISDDDHIDDEEEQAQIDDSHVDDEEEDVINDLGYIRAKLLKIKYCIDILRYKLRIRNKLNRKLRKGRKYSK